MPFRTMYCLKFEQPVNVYVEQDNVPRIGNRTQGKTVSDFECSNRDECEYVNECRAWKVDY